MKPNRFSKLTKDGLGIVGQLVLVVIAMATVGAVVKEIMHIWDAGTITVADAMSAKPMMVTADSERVSSAAPIVMPAAAASAST